MVTYQLLVSFLFKVFQGLGLLLLWLAWWLLCGIGRCTDGNKLCFTGIGHSLHTWRCGNKWQRIGHSRCAQAWPLICKCGSHRQRTGHSRCAQALTLASHHLLHVSHASLHSLAHSTGLLCQALPLGWGRWLCNLEQVGSASDWHMVLSQGSQVFQKPGFRWALLVASFQLVTAQAVWVAGVHIHGRGSCWRRNLVGCKHLCKVLAPLVDALVQWHLPSFLQMKV